MFNVDRVVFHNRIKSLRNARKMTLQDIAGPAGISVTYLSMIEQGKRVPKDDHLKAIAKALKVSVDELRVNSDSRTERRLWKYLMGENQAQASNLFLFGRKLRMFRRLQNVSVRALCELPRSQAVNLQAWRVREFELGSLQPAPEDIHALAVGFGFESTDEFMAAVEAVNGSLDADIDGPEGLEFRKRAAQKLRAEGDNSGPAFATHLFAEDGLGQHQWIVDGDLLTGPEAFGLRGAQVLVDNSLPLKDGDLVISMRGLSVVGLGRMKDGVPEAADGERLPGDPWRVVAASYV